MKLIKAAPKTIQKIRATYGVIILVFVISSAGFLAIIKTKDFIYESILKYQVHKQETAPFPVSVDPSQKLITENPDIDRFLNGRFKADGVAPDQMSWLWQVASKLAYRDWFQNLASPISRILVILPGERKEEIASAFGKILKWDKGQRDTFLALVATATPQLAEGKFFPDHYVVDKNATPEGVATMLLNKFNSEVLVHYPENLANVVPLKDTLTIASLLEREARDFTDMRQISGVIWNRLFLGMNLQLDATLQYAKGSQAWEPWWPKVNPQDKYIDSPYNTYKNPGLPPTPIGNPSTEAILAALNPVKTDCLYYFHDSSGNFHCSASYEEHVALLRQYYGQGK